MTFMYTVFGKCNWIAPPWLSVLKAKHNKAVLQYARKEGIIEGEKKRSREIAKQMLIDGENPEKIRKYTGASVQWLRRLENEINKKRK